MLSKINRLTSKKDFDIVFNKGKNFKIGSMVFKILKSDFNKIRVGFVVSKKVSNKATIRNKVKRRMRSIVQGQLVNISSSADIIIIALPGIQKEEFLDVKKDIATFFKKTF